MPAAILRDGHEQQAARDLLRMRSAGWSDHFHGIAALMLRAYQADALDQRFPSDILGGDKAGKLVRVHWLRNDAVAPEACPHLGCGDRHLDRPVDLVDDVLGHAERP